MAHEPIKIQGTTGAPPNLERLNRVPERVPASIHEDVFSVPAEFAADGFVLIGRDALKSARIAAEKALEVARATLADETQTVYARHQLARDRTFAATKGGIEKAQKAIERLGEKVEALDDFLKGPKAPMSAVQMIQVAEARRALSSMPPGQRRQAIMAGIASGDPITGWACTRTPGYLLNTTDAEVSDFAQVWAARNHPDVVRQTQVLRQVLEATERGGKLLLSFTTSLSSTQIAEEARKLSTRAQDAVRAIGAE